MLAASFSCIYICISLAELCRFDELVFAFYIRVRAVAQIHAKLRTKVIPSTIIMENTYILVWQQLTRTLCKHSIGFFIISISKLYVYAKYNNELVVTKYVRRCEYINVEYIGMVVWKRRVFDAWQRKYIGERANQSLILVGMPFFSFNYSKIRMKWKSIDQMLSQTILCNFFLEVNETTTTTTTKQQQPKTIWSDRFYSRHWNFQYIAVVLAINSFHRDDCEKMRAGDIMIVCVCMCVFFEGLQ